MATFIFSFTKTIPAATNMGGFMQPGEVDLTADVIAAAQAQGVTLDPRASDKWYCSQPNQVMSSPVPACPGTGQPDPSAGGIHVGWNKDAAPPRAGFSTMYGCGTAFYRACNVESYEVTIQQTAIYIG